MDDSYMAALCGENSGFHTTKKAFGYLVELCGEEETLHSTITFSDSTKPSIARTQGRQKSRKENPLVDHLLKKFGYKKDRATMYQDVKSRVWNDLKQPPVRQGKKTQSEVNKYLQKIYAECDSVKEE